MIKDLRNKTDLELGQLITKLKFELLEIRFKTANGEEVQAYRKKEIKKTIARAMTVLSERNVQISFSTFDTQLITNKNGKQEIKKCSLEEKDLANKSSSTKKTTSADKETKGMKG